MKNGSSKRSFENISSISKRDILENTQRKTNFSSKAVNTMPVQLVTPPARVWEKIEAILDEQDFRRKKANDIIAASFSHDSRAENNRRRIYLATVAGITVLAGVAWLIF